MFFRMYMLLRVSHYECAFRQDVPRSLAGTRILPSMRILRYQDLLTDWQMFLHLGLLYQRLLLPLGWRMGLRESSWMSTWCLHDSLCSIRRLLWWCLHCSALIALRLKMQWRKWWLKFFSSLHYTNFTAAKVWQENEDYFSEKPANWSVLPK